MTCLSSEGCSPERLRYCVDPLALRCRSRDEDSADEDENTTDSPEGDESPGESSDDDNDDDDDDESGIYFSLDVFDKESKSLFHAVCGDDGRTYASLCNLVQDSLQTDVAYDGSCNRTECIGGEVYG